MISPIRAADDIFDDAARVIDLSGVVEMIETFYEHDRLPGGRISSGIDYTVRAVLVAALVRIIGCTPPSYTGILTTIAHFDDRQLSAVGMGNQDLTALRRDNDAEYGRFHAWLNRRFAPLDPGRDLPAKRVKNADHAAAVRTRSPQQHQHSQVAAARIHSVMNRLVAASIDDPSPPAYRGDIVADESIFDLANHSAGLGSRPEKYRAAAYCGRYYVRDGKTGAVHTVTKPHEIRKAAFGIGLTAVTRVGPPDALHVVAPVIVGIAVFEPTSGSVPGLQAALDGMRENGLGARRSARARWPHLTIDMGYNPKRGFADLMLDYEYSPVARYPKTWNLTFASVHPRSEESRRPSGNGAELKPPPLPGPVQIAGAFYCPAALDFADLHRARRTREMLADKEFRLHDDRLRRLLPLLMGTNSRPHRARTIPGRPALGAPEPMSVKQELVCPAAQRRVRCPLKPDSVTETPSGTLTVTPTWAAADKVCCAKSSVTVTLTPDQLRMAQWNLVPGSWEHALYFEAARSLTEQRFSLLKSPHITGIASLTWGPRREPMIKIILALAVAATNLRIQAKFDPQKARIESTKVRWRQLAAHLGHEPVRVPPRT